MTELKLPSLGEGIEKGTVIAIMVKVGDVISIEQSLLEVETDKVVVEVPSDAAGVVNAILVELGDEIGEGVPIIKLKVENSESISELSSEITENFHEKQPEAAMILVKEPNIETKAISKVLKTTLYTKEVKLPSLGEGIENGTIIAIHVAEGDTIKAEQTLMEVETDKVVVEVPADTSGEITKIWVSIGEEIGEGTPIFSIAADQSMEPEEVVAEKINITSKSKEIVPKKGVETKKVTLPEIHSGHARRKGVFRASPLAKKIAREIGIDITSMPLETNRKRISVQDVKNYAKALNQNRTVGDRIPQMSLPDFEKWGAIRKESMSGIMQTTNKNMTTSWSQIPHAWLQEKVDITYLEEKRQAHKNEIKSKGGSLTITGILVKVVAKALVDFPIFNASIDSQKTSVIYKDYINIGVAVDTDRGLLVPVLKNADQKNITDIAFELGGLADKVKTKKITANELEGATFTISNLGGIGTTAIFPLVTFPQVAILGVAASQTEAVYLNGQFQPRLLMPLTIGFDHRIINGADAARFLKHIKTLLEDWFMWNL